MSYNDNYYDSLNDNDAYDENSQYTLDADIDAIIASASNDDYKKYKRPEIQDAEIIEEIEEIEEIDDIEPVQEPVKEPVQEPIISKNIQADYNYSAGVLKKINIKTVKNETYTLSAPAFSFHEKSRNFFSTIGLNDNLEFSDDKTYNWEEAFQNNNPDEFYYILPRNQKYLDMLESFTVDQNNNVEREYCLVMAQTSDYIEYLAFKKPEQIIAAYKLERLKSRPKTNPDVILKDGTEITWSSKKKINGKYFDTMEEFIAEKKRMQEQAAKTVEPIEAKIVEPIKEAVIETKTAPIEAPVIASNDVPSTKTPKVKKNAAKRTRTTKVSDDVKNDRKTKKELADIFNVSIASINRLYLSPIGKCGKENLYSLKAATKKFEKKETKKEETAIAINKKRKNKAVIRKNKKQAAKAQAKKEIKRLQQKAEKQIAQIKERLAKKVAKIKNKQAGKKGVNNDNLS